MLCVYVRQCKRALGVLGNSESPVGVALLRTINCKWEEILVSAFYGQYDTASHFKRKDVSQIIIHTLGFAILVERII